MGFRWVLFPMIKFLAIFMVLLATLLGLLVLAMPVVVTNPQVHTLYIGYDVDDADQPAAKITHVAQTSHLGIRPPFVPVCVVETRHLERSVVSALPFGGMVLGSWARDTRSVIVRIIDGEDRDGELRYWHFPPENELNTNGPFVEDTERHFAEMGLPESVGESFNDHLNAVYGIGDPIEEPRRDEMISLAIGALGESEFAWAGELIGAREASVTSNTSTGFSGVLMYSGFSVLIAVIVGITTWFRIRNSS